MAKKIPLSDNPDIALDQLAIDIARGSIVEQATARLVRQIIEFVFETYVKPLRAENARLKETIKALDDGN